MEEKLEIRHLGPDKPDLNIIQQTKDRGKTYNITIVMKRNNVYVVAQRETLFPMSTWEVHRTRGYMDHGSE